MDVQFAISCLPQPDVFVAEIADSEPRPGEALAILRAHHDECALVLMAALGTMLAMPLTRLALHRTGRKAGFVTPPTIKAPYGKPAEASRVISTEGNRTERTTVSPSASHECTMSGPKIT
jgi:hypothetical protein